ncbi:translation initiation factor IF-2-like [Lutra lutra]|uniref:translation initiation factor IF-2-like n=1 Tax=Lutra lutra TaxID=9657 RepID=UPI001FD1D01D|nr:translation initiation factor IF-2-like [Lutra lutra]
MTARRLSRSAPAPSCPPSPDPRSAPAPQAAGASPTRAQPTETAAGLSLPAESPAPAPLPGGGAAPRPQWPGGDCLPLDWLCRRRSFLRRGRDFRLPREAWPTGPGGPRVWSRSGTTVLFALVSFPRRSSVPRRRSQRRSELPASSPGPGARGPESESACRASHRLSPVAGARGPGRACSLRACSGRSPDLKLHVRVQTREMISSFLYLVSRSRRRTGGLRCQLNGSESLQSGILGVLPPPSPSVLPYPSPTSRSDPPAPARTLAALNFSPRTPAR